MKESKYSIRRALLKEGITFENRKYDQTEFPHIPVDDIAFIHPEVDDWFPGWWNDYGSQTTTKDMMQMALMTMDYFFQTNPKAAADVRQKLASTQKSPFTKTALPIFADSANEGDPPKYVMYKGKITPPSLVARRVRWRKRITDLGNEAEEGFKNWLSTKRLPATIIGGSSKPDVVSLGFKFELGSGPKKELNMGTRNGKVTKAVQPRRDALDKHSPDRGMIEPDGVHEIWRASGYDYLVMSDGSDWAIFSLSDRSDNPPMEIQRWAFDGKMPQKLDASMCGRVRPQISQGAWIIKYNSLDWTKATRYPKR